MITLGFKKFQQLWMINSEENEKKAPSVSYQTSLSYHNGAVNALRFSPSGKVVHLALLKSWVGIF